MPEADTCHCGHVRDEHEGGGPCAIFPCMCVHFEHDKEGDALIERQEADYDGRKNLNPGYEADRQ